MADCSLPWNPWCVRLTSDLQVLCSVKASERCYDAELELDGSVRFKSGRPATFTSLQQLQDHIDRDEQGAAAADQGLLARGFKVSAWTRAHAAATRWWPVRWDDAVRA